MVKVIKHNRHHEEDDRFGWIARITCSCGCVFEASEYELQYTAVAHGVYEKAIRCPDCGSLCHQWQGGCESWRWITED